MKKPTTRKVPATRDGGRRALSARRDLAAVQERLASVEADHRRLSGQFVLLEQQVTRLSFLYTVARQLLESVEPKALVQAVAETVINIVGSEDFALYERDPASGRWSLLVSTGESAQRVGPPCEGEGPLGKLLSASEMQLAPGNGVAAYVPLRYLDRVVGALVVFHLLPHKPALEQVDRDLLSLFGSNAARALHCARLEADVANRGLA
ncbi:MAG: GAF domain-containing protein [Myxococcales bacterium]